MSLLERTKDKIVGIFDNAPDKPQKEPINTPVQQKLLTMVDEDWQVFKEYKQDFDEQCKLEKQIYAGDHWKGLRTDTAIKNRPSNVDNIAGAQIDAILGKITGWDPFPDFEAQEEQDEQKARDLNDFIPFELRQIGFRTKYGLAVKNAVLHGPLVMQMTYDPTVEGGRGKNRYDGQNDIIPVELENFFPDPRVRDFIYLQKMGAIIKRFHHNMEYIRERWGTQGEKVFQDGTSPEDNSQSDFNHTDYSTGQAHTYRNTAEVLEYWYRGLPKLVTKEDKELFEERVKSLYDEGKDPSETIAKADGTMEGIHCIYISTNGVFLEHKAYVYDHGKYPFSARTICPIDGYIWGKGFMRDMVKPQQMLNRFAELAVETMSKQGNAAIMYEEGAIGKNQVRVWKETRSTPGAMLPVAMNGLSGNKVKEMQGVDVPTTIFNMIQHYLDMLQKIPGQFDSANGQASSNVTSGEQAKALISAASTRLNTVTDAIQEMLEEVFSQYIELIAQFYTTERVARVTGRKVAISRDSLVNSVDTQMTFDTGEVKDLAEEYVPLFDIKVNIAADKPVDREYWIQMAFNLLQTVDPITQLPMIDAEAVRYTVQNGRMEPMDVIKQRIEEAAGIQQQQQEMMAQAEQLAQENQALQQQVQQYDQQMQQTNQEDKLFDQSMQEQKIRLETAKVAGDLLTKAESNSNVNKSTQRK